MFLLGRGLVSRWQIQAWCWEWNHQDWGSRKDTPVYWNDANIELVLYEPISCLNQFVPRFYWVPKSLVFFTTTICVVCIHRGASNSNTRIANIASLLKCHGPYIVFIGMAHITDSSRRLALIQLAHRPSSWIWRSIPKKYHCKSLSRLYSWVLKFNAMGGYTDSYIYICTYMYIIRSHDSMIL